MSSPPIPQRKRSADTADNVLRRLVEAILAGDLEGDSPLREAALARDWNVSRTPMREAVRRAAEGGLLVLRPNQAPLIRKLSIADVRALYDLRAILEVHALDLAWPALIGRPAEKMLALGRRVQPESSGWLHRCLQFDLKLHCWWTESCGNAWLKADLDRYYRFLPIFQRWVGRDPAAVAQGYREHMLIVEAVCDGDKSRARRALTYHIRQSVGLVEAAMLDGKAKGSASSARPRTAVVGT